MYLGLFLSHAKVAQSVEHFTRNEGVAGSNPAFSLGTRGSDEAEPLRNPGFVIEK